MSLCFLYFSTIHSKIFKRIIVNKLRIVDHYNTKKNRFHFDTRDSEDGLNSDAIGPSAQRSDSALYSCLAKNNFGSSERKLRVVVMERPDKPEQVDIVQVSSRSISLRWLAPFDGNSPITRYQFEYKRHKGELFVFTFRRFYRCDLS